MVSRMARNKLIAVRVYDEVFDDLGILITSLTLEQVETYLRKFKEDFPGSKDLEKIKQYIVRGHIFKVAKIYDTQL